METLLNKLEKAERLTESTVKDNPVITAIWFEFNNCDLDEMRTLAVKYNKKLYFTESHMAMTLHLGFRNAVIFCYSQKVKIEEHVVIDNAYKNV